MRTEYGALLEKLSSYYDRTAFDGFSHFAGMRGYRYSRQPKLRMLIVGRSVNGWPSASEGLSAAEFGKHMESIFLDDACNGFSWIKRDTDTGCFTNGEDYHISRSDFWNYSEAVWRSLDELTGNHAEITDGRWFECIAWTNLYKITEKGKTPGLRMTRLQHDESAAILREEIERLLPTFILMEIGYSWFSAFSGLFSSVSAVSDSVVEATAEFQGIPVVVTARPERMRKEEFRDRVIRYPYNWR